jgi:hypothetical protein
MKSRRVEALVGRGQRPNFECRMGIDVPAEIYEWKAAAATRERALEVQSRNREQFIKAFAEGLTVLGYQRDARGSGRFLLGEWEEKWRY